MPAKAPSLRPYRSSDATFITALARRAFGEYSRNAGAASARAAALPGTSTAVALVEGEPVGFATLTLHGARDRRSASLDAIAVEERARGRGVGRALLEHAVRTARDEGARELRLVTAEANLAALDLFLRFGCEIVERLSRYYPRGQNAVSMRKRLAP